VLLRLLVVGVLATLAAQQRRRAVVHDPADCSQPVLISDRHNASSSTLIRQQNGHIQMSLYCGVIDINVQTVQSTAVDMVLLRRLCCSHVKKYT